MTDAEKQKRIAEIKARIAEIDAEEQAALQAQQEPGIMGKALEHGIELLDLPGGVARTALAGGADLMADTARGMGMELPRYQNYLQAGEASQAFNPIDRKLAPSGDVLLQRAGFGKGGSVSDVLPSMYSETGEGWALKKGGILDPTARGAAGLGLEIATDPLTYATFGIAPALKGAGKIAKASQAAKRVADTALNKPATAALKGLIGKPLYQSAWKKVDEAMGYVGKVDDYAPSEVAYRHNILGSQKQMQKKISEVLPNLRTQYDNILKNAEYAGAEVDMKAAMGEAEKLVDGILNAEKKDPQLIQVAKEMKDKILQYKQMARREPSTVITQVESNLLDHQGRNFKLSVSEYVPGQRGVLPTEAEAFKKTLGRKTKWDSIAQLDFDEQVTKAMAKGLREQLKKAASKVDRGDELQHLGREMGALLSSRKALRGEVGRETTKNLFTTIDAMSLWAEPSLFATKKAADIAKGARFRTGVGYGARKLGEKGDPLLDILTRRGAAETMYTPAVDRPGYAPVSAWQKVGR